MRNPVRGFAFLNKLALVFESKPSRPLRKKSLKTVPVQEVVPKAANETLPPPPRKLFTTFDIALDLHWIAERIQKPVVHLIVEDRASTSYNMVAIVVESPETGEWYVFPRRRVSFLGYRPGQINMGDVIERFREHQAVFASWVAPQRALARFEAGYTLWNQMQPSLVPLLAYSSKDVVWLEQRQRFLLLSKPE
jgi:hypothetical protein